MRIAVIGTGISGMAAAHLLCDEHDITVFEANAYIGGHTHTQDVSLATGVYAVDTGFVVFNEATCPNFAKLLDRLGTASKPTRVGFSVRCDKTDFEWGKSSLRPMLAQRGSLLRPRFRAMMGEFKQFSRDASELTESADGGQTMGEFLDSRNYSPQFVDYFIAPLGSAIWAADAAEFRQFPAKLFVEFFQTHRLLDARGGPQWLVVDGGSQRYAERLVEPFRDRVRLNCKVESVRRLPDAVEVTAKGGEPERFDHVIIATHSDDALAMLADPSDAERDVLGAMPYKTRDMVLHFDRSMLPKRRATWAGWNYLVPADGQPVALTYDMNLLQGLGAPVEFCVTINNTDVVHESKIVKRMTARLPLYTRESRAAQKRCDEISGVDRTHYCGAYWGYGFHEDGLKSALAVCQHFGKTL